MQPIRVKPVLPEKFTNKAKSPRDNYHLRKLASDVDNQENIIIGEEKVVAPHILPITIG